MAERNFYTFFATGYDFLIDLANFLGNPPMSSYWDEWGLRGHEFGNERESRLMVRHIESGEVFNLIQHSYRFQEILTIHSCADTIYRELYSVWGITNYFRPNYNVPSSSFQLTYPVGTTPIAYSDPARFTIIGTSQFVFAGSETEKDGAPFSSQGIFGFLDSYDDLRYKITGGIPTDTRTLRAIDFEHHFWETGYQNFTARFVEGTTFHLTTFQVHDYAEFSLQSYGDNYLFPLMYFEEGGPGYSGRIAGEIPDCWRLANLATGLSTGDDLWLGDVAGASVMGRVFKDGENLSKAIVARYK